MKKGRWMNQLCVWLCVCSVLSMTSREQLMSRSLEVRKIEICRK